MLILLICTFLSILFSNFQLIKYNCYIISLRKNIVLTLTFHAFPVPFSRQKTKFFVAISRRNSLYFLQVPVFQEYNPFKFTSNLFENSPMLPSSSSTVKTADKKKLSAKSYALEPTLPPPPLSKKGCYQVNNNKASLSNKVTMYFPSWYHVYDKQ